MKTYARIQSGLVAEVIPPAVWDTDTYVVDADGTVTDQVLHHVGDEISLSDRYVPEFVAACVDVTDIIPTPKVGWTYDGTTFAPYVAPPPTPAQILATNTATRNQLLAAATLAIAPLQDAVDIGEATDADTTMLTAWKQFRVAVNRVVLTVQNPTWPAPPQLGYGAAITPPVSSS